VFLNEFKQINSFVVVIENFITKKTPIEKLYFKLNKIKKHGEKFLEKLIEFLNNFLNNLNDENKLRGEFLELFPYLTVFSNALKIEKNVEKTKDETDGEIDNLNKPIKDELKKSSHEIIRYIKDFTSNLKNKLGENPVKNYEKNNWQNLKEYFPQEIKVVFKFI